MNDKFLSETRTLLLQVYNGLPCRYSENQLKKSFQRVFSLWSPLGKEMGLDKEKKRFESRRFVVAQKNILRIIRKKT